MSTITAINITTKANENDEIGTAWTEALIAGNADRSEVIDVIAGSTDLGDDDINAIADLIMAMDDEALAARRVEWDLCPVHGCDIGICLDDEAECVHEG